MENEEILEAIAKQNQVLEKLDIMEAARGDVLSQLLIIEKEREKRELETISFSYPNDGTVATLGVGKTVLDFYSGRVIDVDRVVTKMYHTLQSEGEQTLRSYMVNANKAIGLRIGGGDTKYIEDGYAIGRYLDFKKMSVITTVETELFVHVSTNPNTTLELTSDKSRIVVIEEAVVIDPLSVTGDSNNLLKLLLKREE